MVNLQAEYKISQNLEVAVGAKNLLDRNYELSWGLPQQGRNFFAKARFTY